MAKIPEHVDDWKGDADLLYPSKYLHAADLEGRDCTVTIKRVEKGAELIMQGGKKDTKPVLHLQETPKQVVLAKTNKRRIVDMYGVKCADWIGQRITLYPSAGPSTEDVLKAGQRGIRVRTTKPKPKPARPAAQQAADEQPADEIDGLL